MDELQVLSNSDEPFGDMICKMNLRWWKLPQNQDNELYRSQLKKEIASWMMVFADDGRLEQWEDEGKSEDDIHGNALRRAKDSTVEYLAEQYRDKLCPFEKREVDKTLGLFDQQYELSDPRAHIIVRSVISDMLTTFRIERYTQQEGEFDLLTDKEGNTFFQLSNLADAKRRFNEGMVKAIEKLDKIFEGIKINNINQVMSVQDVMNLMPRSEKIINIPQTGDKKIEVPVVDSDPKS